MARNFDRSPMGCRTCVGVDPVTAAQCEAAGGMLPPAWQTQVSAAAKSSPDVMRKVADTLDAAAVMYADPSVSSNFKLVANCLRAKADGTLFDDGTPVPPSDGPIPIPTVPPPPGLPAALPPLPAVPQPGAPIGMPTPSNLAQPSKQESKTDYALVLGVGAVAALLFFGTLKVK